MSKLDLGWNRVDDDAADCLSSCIHNLEELDLSDCQLTTRGIKQLSNAIKSRSYRV